MKWNQYLPAGSEPYLPLDFTYLVQPRPPDLTIRDYHTTASSRHVNQFYNTKGAGTHQLSLPLSRASPGHSYGRCSRMSVPSARINDTR